MVHKRDSINTGGIAITQIFLLIVSILAFSYILGNSIPSVSAQIDGHGTEPPGHPEDPSHNQNRDSDTDEGAGAKQETDPIRYKSGEWVAAEGEAYQIKEDDLNKDGSAKEDSSLGKWISRIGGNIVGGVIQDEVRGSIAGKTTQEAAQAAATGAEVAGGRFLFDKSGLVNWGHFGSHWLVTGATIISNAAIGTFVNYAIWKWVVKADARNMKSATKGGIIAGASGGVLAGTIAAIAGGPVGWAAFGGSLLVGGAWHLYKYQRYSREVFVYTVGSWKAPAGGEFCDDCNDLEFGCSEYQCRSFGKGCEIINEGTEEQACVWKDDQDISPPVIIALEKVLPSDDYSYEPLPEPGATGVKIAYDKDPSEKQCIPPYTAITLGVETDKFADCRIDTERVPFGEMIASMTNFEGFEREHVLHFPHAASPSVESQRSLGVPDHLITNGQMMEFFIKCESFNGYVNEDEYIMEFCVQDGPDTFPPEILGTNYNSEAFISFNQSEAYLEIYTDEPAECKWSFDDLDYDSMEFEMETCSMEEGDYMFNPLVYGCIGNLAGLKDRIENEIYIKCKDKPWWEEEMEGARFANEDPFILTLKGTEPLIIDEVTVNGEPNGTTIRDNVRDIKVKFEIKTLFGAERGKANCEYNFEDQWLEFHNEGREDFATHINTHHIYRQEGSYRYDIQCIDKGGNVAQDTVEFSIKLDNEPPVIVRAFREGNDLKIITDEEAECVYNTDVDMGCRYNLDEGLSMSSDSAGRVHSTEWNANRNFYIKCQDNFGNQPNLCSMTVRPFDVS